MRPAATRPGEQVNDAGGCTAADEISTLLGALTTRPMPRDAFVARIATQLHHLPEGGACGMYEQLRGAGVLKEIFGPIHFRINREGMAEQLPSTFEVAITAAGRNLLA